MTGEAEESFPTCSDMVDDSLSSTDSASVSAAPPGPSSRRRARSNAVRESDNPIETPLTTDDQALANLVRSINAANERDAQEKKKVLRDEFTALSGDGSESDSESDTSTDTQLYTTSTGDYPTNRIRIPLRSAEDFAQDHERRAKRREEERERARINMNYQNYLDSNAAGSGGGGAGGPRQAPPSPAQNNNHGNGMNGMGGGGAMAGLPTPAGHQSDLNFIMSMVEQLSLQLDANQRVTAGVVEKIGRVRDKASTMDLSNDEVIGMMASEMNDETKNLEKECSELRQKLEASEHNKNENWKLVIHGCNILTDILDKMHKFKSQHELDTLAWHKNYRQQLAAERQENLDLRNHINDMRAAAARANDHLRQLRRYLTDHDELRELRVQNIALRQEKRWWKRMAMPHLPDDDSEFSDDDDLIDPEEKKRLAAEAAEKEGGGKEKEAEGAAGAQGQTV